MWGEYYTVDHEFWRVIRLWHLTLSFHSRCHAVNTVWCLWWQLAKLEVVQQRSTVESIDNSHVRPYIVKLINVGLSFLALLLIVINFAVNLLHPFLNTRSVTANLVVLKCFDGACIDFRASGYFASCCMLILAYESWAWIEDELHWNEYDQMDVWG